jgi:uncharacterized 2Fe-2S/4Fe-4S cluster protein (DUF4445 family)
MNDAFFTQPSAVPVCSITVMPERVQVPAIPGASILESLVSAGVPVRAGCGGHRTCGRCAVRLLAGEVEGGAGAGLGRRGDDWILACAARPRTDIVVEVPPSARIVPVQGTEVGDACADPCADTATVLAFRGWEVRPPVFVVPGPVPPPSRENPLADAERVQQLCLDHGFRCGVPGLAPLRTLPSQLRTAEWRVDAVLADVGGGAWVLDGVVGCGCARSWYGVAVDVGTTAIAVSLVSLSDLQVVAGATAPNGQAAYGDDVITRIIASERPDGAGRLQAAVRETVNACIRHACRTAGVSGDSVRAVVFSGNTTMMHLLYGIPAGWLRREPYVPAAREMPVVRARELGIDIHPESPVRAVPSVASYVGGDIVAGVLAVGMDRREDVAVLMDVGTNGEIAVGNRDYLVAAACSAGPAFEGSGVSCGMRATAGAIEDVSIDEKGVITLRVIGGGRPAGVCGSGLIALPVELLHAGVMDRAGFFATVPPEHPLNTRFRVNAAGERVFVLAPAAETVSGEDIVVSEADIAAVLRAKGAMFHGLHTVLRSLDISFDRIATIFLAGGFGSYLDVAKAIALGMVPDIPVERYVVAGNTSLAGARLYLASDGARAAAADIAARTTVVELSSDPDYLSGYAASVFIPHTDLSLFPTAASRAKSCRGIP